MSSPHHGEEIDIEASKSRFISVETHFNRNSKSRYNILTYFRHLQESYVQTHQVASEPNSSLGSVVLQQWAWLLKLQRIFGCFPYSINEAKESVLASKSFDQVFEFKFYSKITFYTFVFGLIRIITCMSQFSDWGEFILGRSYESSVEDWIVRSTNYAIPFVHICDLISTWLVIRSTQTFFNSWPSFERQFTETFQSRGKYKSNLRNYALFFFTGSLLVNIGMTLFFWFMLYRQRIKVNFLAQLLFAFSKSIIQIAANGEEIKKALMYQSLSEGFHNLRKSIEERLTIIADMPKSAQQLSPEEVCNWRKLLIQLRKMVQVAGEAQTPHESIILIHTVVVYTESLFIVIKALITESWSNSAILFGVLSWTILAKCIIKTVLAQRITNQETQLAEVLMDVDPTASTEIHATIELRKMIELIHSSPSKISLSGFVTIEKQLLAKISSYIVAYLVVLFQFHFSSSNLKLDCSSIGQQSSDSTTTTMTTSTHEDISANITDY